MDESPVDLTEIVWVSEQQSGRHQLDPSHNAQVLAREREAAERRTFGPQRDALCEAYEAVDGSTRSLFGLVGRLIHDLKPMHNVRHHSEVRHFAWCSFDELTRAIDESKPLVLRVGRVRLRCSPGRVKSDPRRYEADGRLHLPASRPDLLVRLVIEPWWRNRTAVTLTLRPSHRLRYPRRYFEAAHEVVSEVTAVAQAKQVAVSAG